MSKTLPPTSETIPTSRAKIFTKIAVPISLGIFFAAWLAVFFGVLNPVFYQLAVLIIFFILIVVGLTHIFIKDSRLFALVLLGTALVCFFWVDLINPSQISDSLRTFHITSLNAKEARLTGRGYIQHNLFQWEGPGSRFYVIFDKESQELLIKSGLAEKGWWSGYASLFKISPLDAPIRPINLRKKQIYGIFNFKHDFCAELEDQEGRPLGCVGPALLIIDFH